MASMPCSHLPKTVTSPGAVPATLQSARSVRGLERARRSNAVRETELCRHCGSTLSGCSRSLRVACATM